MRSLVRDRDRDVSYYALNYLAKGCDGEALRILSAPPYRVLAHCQQWAETVALFGACRYSRGGGLLVSSLGHACGNVVAAADQSLRQLFPDAPATFESVAAEVEYFKARIKKPEGKK